MIFGINYLNLKLKIWTNSVTKLKCAPIFTKFSTQNKWHKGRYTYEVHENCLILKTLHPLVQLRPPLFHSLDLGRPISTEFPLSPNDNQSIKRKHNPRMTIYMLSGLSFKSAFVFSINSLSFLAFH